MAELMTVSAGQEALPYTRAGYRAALESALARGYAFLPFDDPRRDELEHVCLLRHDVDADPEAAAELARLEAAEGIGATYFVMLRSPLYNLFGRANSELVREILSFGHALGLHYDVCFDDGSGRTLAEGVALERRILEDVFETSVSAVSFHQPTLSAEPPELDLPGVVNANDREQLSGFAYLSDSNKAVRAADLPRLFREAVHPRLQLLVHPLWWVGDDAAATAPALWDAAILRNWNRVQRQLLGVEAAYGGERQFRIDPKPGP
jgi:hypothetical protein